MKTTLATSLFVFTVLASSHGEGPVYDMKVEQQLIEANKYLKDITPNVTALLNTANKQLDELKASTEETSKIKDAVEEVSEKIDGLIKVFGDPNAEKPSEIGTLRDRVIEWKRDGGLGDPPKYDEVSNPDSQDDGKAAFDIDSGGLVDKIKSTYKPDPTKDATKPRDPKLYATGVDQLAAVSQYYTTREDALHRRESLQDLLKDALDELRKAKNFALVHKYAALVSAIQGQLQACNDDINNSFNDVTVRAIKNFTVSQIKQTADNEAMNKQMEDKMTELTDGIKNGPKKPGTPTTPTSGGYAAGLLPWKKFSY